MQGNDINKKRTRYKTCIVVSPLRTSNPKISFTGLQNDFCRTQLVPARLGCGLSLVRVGSCLLYVSLHSATCPGPVLQMMDARNKRHQAQPCKYIYIFWSNLANLMSSHIYHLPLTKTSDRGYPKSWGREVFTIINEVMISTGREERELSK